jgi:uncharacterized protein YrrD
MADPVSWYMIERGWQVLEADGKEIGSVEDVVGDASADIFNGLSISTGLLSGDRYVPAEDVEEIREGLVKLRLGREQLRALRSYEKPPVSEQFLAPDRER